MHWIYMQLFALQSIKIESIWNYIHFVWNQKKMYITLERRQCVFIEF